MKYDWKFFLLALLFWPLKWKPVVWLLRLLLRPVGFIPALLALGIIIGVLAS